MLRIILLIFSALLVAHTSWAASTTVVGGPDTSIKTSGGVVIEDVVPSLVTTEIDHWMAHVGAAYLLSDFMIIPAGGSTEFLFRNTTSSGSHMQHFIFISTQADAEISLYESSTVAFVGTTTVMRNANRNYPDSSEIQVFINASTTDLGVQLEHDIITGTKQTGGSGGSTHEWILAEDTDYIIQYINNSGQEDHMTYHFDFLEVGLLP